MHTIIRPFRRASDLVNKLPFIGKFSVRPILIWAYQAPPDERILRVLLAIAFLLFFITAHANQAFQALRIASLSEVLVFKAFAYSYATANTLVVYTQVFLLFRLMLRVTRFEKVYVKPLAGPRLDYKHFIVCLVFTGIGQLAMVTISEITLGR